jgi:PAS domain S-box-containing protein
MQWEKMDATVETLVARFVQQLPGEAIYGLDPHGRIISWNAGAERITGYPASEAIGRHFSFLYPPEEALLGGHGREITRAEREGRSESEGWRLTRSGDRIWVSVSMAAVRDDDGRTIGFCRSERDTTEQLRSEQELRLSEAKFSGMIAISTDAIISTDENRRIVVFNRGAEEVFGYEAGEVLGEPLEILIPPRFRDAHPAHVDAFGRGEHAARAMGRHRSEIRGLRKDGSEFPAEASISKLDVEGRRIYTAVLRDVTERHETERRIADLLAREQEARAEAEQAADRARFLADAGSLLSSSLVYEDTLRTLASLVSPRIADGCSISMLEGRELRLIEVTHRAMAEHERQRLLASPVTSPSSWEAVRSGRGVLVHAPLGDDPLDVFWSGLAAHSMIKAPIASRGQVLGVVALIATEPDRRFDDETLPLAEELGRRAALAVDNARLYQESRRASTARDDMLHAVSHDLGNSLGAVMVSTAVLLRTLPEDAPDSARERVRGIRALADQMQRLRQDLLDAASIEAGRLSVDPDVQDPAELIAAAAAHWSPVAEERGITFLAEGGACGPVVADPGRIHQVISNLVGNALKFTRPGGTATLRCAPDGEAIRFTVTDTGAGIAESDLPHVFDRFWRTRESNRLGTGLGLAIAKGIVEAHGGRIWVESRPGIGSSFHFTLPAPEE